MKSKIIIGTVAAVAVLGGGYTVSRMDFIGTGKVGIVYNYKDGVQDTVLTPGMHFIAPMNKVKEFSTSNEILVLTNVTLWDCGRQQRESSTTCSTRTNMSRISKISISYWSTGTGMFPVTMVHRTQRYSCYGIKEPTENGTASGSITIPEETKVNRKQIQNMQTT